MRVITVTRKRLLTILFGVLAIVLAAAAGVRGVQAVQASAAKRLLPIYNVKTEEKKIAISFDAAWGNEETQTLIDILKEYNVKTTFFVVGAWVDKYPDSVKALTAAGHEVCNHSDTHPHMPKLSENDMKKQISSCNDKIKAVTGTSPILFRPPYGDYNNPVIKTTQDLGMYAIQWDVETLNIKINWLPDFVSESLFRVYSSPVVPDATAPLSPESAVCFPVAAWPAPMEAAAGTSVLTISPVGVKVALPLIVTPVPALAASTSPSPTIYATTEPSAMMTPVICDVSVLIPSRAITPTTRPATATQNLRDVSFFFQSIRISFFPL